MEVMDIQHVWQFDRPTFGSGLRPALRARRVSQPLEPAVALYGTEL